MMKELKERLLLTINKVIPLKDYESNDCIFSQKYSITSVSMVYILMKLTDEFNFTITDDFVDSLEACTFGDLENLLVQYEGRMSVTA